MGGRRWRGGWFWFGGVEDGNGLEGRGGKERERDEIRQRIGFGPFAPWPGALHTVEDMRLVDGTSAHLLRSNRLYSFIGFSAFLPCSLYYPILAISRSLSLSN
jgi:hypothetical protein